MAIGEARRPAGPGSGREPGGAGAYRLAWTADVDLTAGLGGSRGGITLTQHWFRKG